MCILNSTGPHIKASIKAFLYLYNQYILHTRVNYTRKPMSMSPVHVYSNVHLSPIIQCLFHFFKNSNEFYAQSFQKKSLSLPLIRRLFSLTWWSLSRFWPLWFATTDLVCVPDQFLPPTPVHQVKRPGCSQNQPI